jgi:hypothetical protein
MASEIMSRVGFIGLGVIGRPMLKDLCSLLGDLALCVRQFVWKGGPFLCM